MSSHYNIHIPVKPHLKKFISAKEGDPVRVLNRSVLWTVIRPYLQYKVQDNLTIHQRTQAIKSFTAKITICIGIKRVRSYGLHPRPQSIILINQFLDHYFGKELYWHVKHCELKEGRYKGYNIAIKQFAEKFSIVIEEDISMDSLLWLYKTHRHYENISVQKSSLGKK